MLKRFKKVFAPTLSVSTQALSGVFALLLGGCSGLFGEEFGEEFSRAVGWEKPDIDDKDIKASPPLTVPPDYDLVAPADGSSPPDAAGRTAGRTAAQTAIMAETQTVETLSAPNSPLRAPDGASEQSAKSETGRGLGEMKTATPPDDRRKFDGYENIPAGVRARFDNSLNRYSTVNRRGLGKGSGRQNPATLNRSPTDFSPSQGPAVGPDSEAIASEEFKPEPKTFDGNLCEKVTVRDGRYECLD